MRPNSVLPLLTLGLVLLLAGCDSSDGSSDPGEENPPPEEMECRSWFCLQLLS